jgi:hypothetical protein
MTSIYIAERICFFRRVTCMLCVCAIMLMMIRGETVYAKNGDDKTDRKKVAVPMEEFSVNEAFISSLAGMDLMKRDRYLFNRMNGIVESTAIVSAFDEKGQFRKRYRIVVKSAAIRGIIIQFNIFTENAEYGTLLASGQKFSFRGQLVMVTPVTTRRDYYIFDLILQDGAAVIE